jgi:hypothetical protein
LNLKRILGLVPLMGLLLGTMPLQLVHAAGINLLANPSVETASGNNVTGWSTNKTGTNTTNFSVVHPGQLGNNALYVTTTSYRSGDAKWMSRAITIKPSTAYDLSDYYKSSVATVIKLDITTTSNSHSYVSLSNAPASSNAYSNYTANFTTPGNAKSISIMHIIHSKGWLYTDNFSLIESAVTQPPTCPVGQTGTPPNCVTPPSQIPPTTVTGVCNTSASGVYVSPTGSDTNTGTSVAPFKTIANAISKVPTGQNVYIMAGTYTEGVINVTKVGTPTSWTGICANPGDKPVIQSSDYWNLFYVSGSAYVEFNGIELQGTAMTVTNAETNGFEVHTSNNIRMYNMAIHDFAGAGIGALDLSDHIDVRGNYIFGNAHWGTYGQSGITFLKLKAINGPAVSGIYNNVIAGNVLWDNDQRVPSTSIGSTVITDGNCIILDSMDDVPYTGRTLIKNNICAHNGARGIHIFESSHADVVNNTLYHNAAGSTMTGVAEMDAIEAWGTTKVSDLTYTGNVVCASVGRLVFDQYQVPTAIPIGNVFNGPNAATYATNNSVVANCTDVLTSPQDAPLTGNWAVTTNYQGKGATWPIAGTSL